MGEVGCLKDGYFQNLQVNGSLTGNKKYIKNVTVAATQLTEEDSGCICIIKAPVGQATAITLPAITATNVGINYEFFIRIECTGGIDILTTGISDTAGDNFIGALRIGINAAWGSTDIQDDGFFYVVAGADINQINMTGNETNGAGEIGSYVRCVAIEFSDAGHSLWQITGLLGTADPDGTGSVIFVNRS